ncbi:MAG: hypothetical protein IKX97_02500, partial [Erysipelotrichaceae bacterium]|nr:hypothetical protein [Erysipelotrichaceae bacterium]
MEKYYLQDEKAVIEALNTTADGLSSAEAEKRLAENGKNKLKEAEKEPLFRKFINSISDPMIIMLIAAAAIQAVVNLLQMKDGFDMSEFADVIV